MTARGGIGPLVLAGSGEYTPTMDIVDSFLLKQIDVTRVVLIATACAQEGEDVMTRWEQMGVAHFKLLGVDATPVRIATSEDANVDTKAEQIARATFVWFSGGSAAYLARTFEGTASWEALEAANRARAVVAGASGGLGVLNPPHTVPDAPGPFGLGLATPVRAVSHFDRMEARRPEMLANMINALAPGQKFAGVDEDTALIWTDGGWVAMGHKRVQIFEKGRPPVLYRHGDRVEGLPNPHRS
jgi:cyanophycinase-like exopeptidase